MMIKQLIVLCLLAISCQSYSTFKPCLRPWHPCLPEGSWQHPQGAQGLDIRCRGITGMAIRKKKEGTSADFRNCREDFSLKMVEGSEAILSNLGGVPSPLLGSFQTTAFRFGTQPSPPCSLLLGHANRSQRQAPLGTRRRRCAQLDALPGMH